MRRQTIYVLILATALFAGSYMGGKTSSAEAAAKVTLAKLDARVKALETKRVKALETKVAALQGELTALGEGDTVVGLQALQRTVDLELGDGETIKGAVYERFAIAESRIRSIETSPALIAVAKLEPLVGHLKIEDDPLDGLAGPRIIFKGANVLIQNRDGAGKADGLGNLILGYNRIGKNAQGNPYEVTRGGSHTLVIGDSHSWQGIGGIVNGTHNTLGAESGNSVVLSGEHNVVDGHTSVVLSGWTNKVKSGGFNAIVAGYDQTIEGGLQSGYNSILAGNQNSITTGWTSSIAGGTDNVISGGGAQSISGGFANIINSPAGCNVISGGDQNTLESGWASIVVGGYRNHVRGTDMWANVLVGGYESLLGNGGGYIAGSSLQVLDQGTEKHPQ
jgi:hypothetical protein